MQLFSTLLDINPSMDKDAFIKLVIEWNQGSPHKKNIIEGIEWHGERNVRYGNDKMWLAIEEYRNKNIIAVRFEKMEDDGSVWDTDYVMNFTDMKMAVILDRSYIDDALFINPKFSIPYFITLLIDKGYLVDDGVLPVLRTPIMVNETNLDIIIDIINGRKKYRMPVVYVSKTFHDEDPVDVKTLASRLKGIAHVLVQESNLTNRKIRNATKDENEYYGSIGIYCSNAIIRHRRYLYHSSIGYDAYLFEKVEKDIVQYWNSQRLDSLYTWLGVNSSILNDRLSAQREERIAAEKAQKDVEQEKELIYDAFDEDIKKLQRQNEELTKKIRRFCSLGG